MMMSRVVIAALLTGLCSAAQAPWPFSLWRKGEAKSKAAEVKKLPAFYHTTKSMASEVSELAASGKCPGLSVTSETDGLYKDKSIQVAVYKAPGTEAKFNTMVVGGEHARELIGSEIALNFVKALCGLAPAKDIEASKKDTEFVIVMNANPGSRAKVEQGDFCTRVNPDHVDINRNFDVDWKNADTDNADTNPGGHAFDQAESRILKNLMEKYKPHAYLDLHSGFRGMFFSNGVAGDNELSMKLQRLVAPVDESTCKCPLGIANAEVGYHTSGSALDYSFMVAKVPFSMAVEVYVDEEQVSDISALEARWETQKQKLLLPLKKGSSFMENGVSPNPDFFKMQFIQAMGGAAKNPGADSVHCLKLFNPVVESSFNQVLASWTNALAELSIKSREIPKNAASTALGLLKKKSPSAFSEREPVEPASQPYWAQNNVVIAFELLGVFLAVYLAIKYFKLKSQQHQKLGEAAPFAAQMRPVQMAD